MAVPTLSPLDRMMIEHECQRLVHLFINLSDARDWDTLADLFTADAVFARPSDPANPLVGREVIRAAYHARPRGRMTRHLATNCVITVEGAEAATGFSYVTLYTAPEVETGAAKADPVQLIGAFRDRFRREGGVWRFAERLGSISIRVGG